MIEIVPVHGLSHGAEGHIAALRVSYFFSILVVQLPAEARGPLSLTVVSNWQAGLKKMRHLHGQ